MPCPGGTEPAKCLRGGGEDGKLVEDETLQDQGFLHSQAVGTVLKSSLPLAPRAHPSLAPIEPDTPSSPSH